MKIRHCVYGLLSLGLLLSSLGTHAEESDRIAEPRCLDLSRIRDLKIIDNQTLVFEMNQKRMYLNTLPYRCPGLDRNSTIMYRTTLNQLCDLDIITVLDPMGRGFMPGASCGLGKFSLLSDDQYKSLKAARE